MGLNKSHMCSTFVWQTIFKTLGFEGSNVDTSLFVHNFGGEFVVLLMYVDNIILASINPVAFPKLLVELGLRFAMKDLGLIHYFLGIAAYGMDSDLDLT